MKIPLKIVFHGIERSEAVEAKIRQRAEELDQFTPLVQRCEVWIDAPHGHHRKGNLYNVRVRATVTGEELEIDRQPDRDDVYVAIRDAFDAMRRRIEDYQRRYRGEVKRHAPEAHGRVVRIFPEEGYGFLHTAEGREIYFHRNSARDVAFEEIRPGDEVSFAEEAGAEGPQASFVKLVAEGAPA